MDPDRWWESAACLGLNTDDFFPTSGMIPRESFTICWTCPVRHECLESALQEESQLGAYRYGIRGGVSAIGRERLVKGRKRRLKGFDG